METDLNNMTMRDLFAAFALAGLLAKEGNIYHASLLAYKHADDMLKQRNEDDKRL